MAVHVPVTAFSFKGWDMWHYRILNLWRRSCTKLISISFCTLIFMLQYYKLIADTVLLFVQIFYFIGFGMFCLESVLSIWVIQVFVLSFDKRTCNILCSVAAEVPGFLFNTPFSLYMCSKYTCTSGEVVKLLKWGRREQDGLWGQQYKGKETCNQMKRWCLCIDLGCICP